MADQFRHELKYYINFSDYMQLKSRLKVLLSCDDNALADGSYIVRSLYFDNYRDKAVTEKLMGSNRREKFRLRYYNDNCSQLNLEKKMKVNKLTQKQKAPLSQEHCRCLLTGKQNFLPDTGNKLMLELFDKMNKEQLRPRTIVSYRREAFVYPPGNVRVTIDSNIRSSDHIEHFLDPNCITIPVAQAIILEIKFDCFLPDLVRDAVQLGARNQTEFSKYIVSRVAL